MLSFCLDTISGEVTFLYRVYGPTLLRFVSYLSTQATVFQTLHASKVPTSVMDTACLDPCIPFPIESEDVTHLETTSEEESIKKLSLWDNYCCKRHTLFPLPFPRHLFKFARSIQTKVNLVYHRAAYDDKFLEHALQSTVKTDPFTAEIYKIYERIRDAKKGQEFSLGLFRCDYMLNVPEEKGSNLLELKQVELNTIASAFAAMAPIYRQQHYENLDYLGYGGKVNDMPDNPSALLMPLGIIKAWEHYGKPKAVVLIVMEENMEDITDILHYEHSISLHNPKVKIIRRPFSDLRSSARLESGSLFVEDLEVAVVYYRTGYIPEQYGPGDWNLRMMFEESDAVKCPSVRYHLVGTKKMQQELSRVDAIEKYLPDTESCNSIRETFAGLWSLDMGEEGDKVAEMAMEKPEKFVMKPQREGGGHNVYKEEVRNLLEKLKSSEDRQAYILMQLLQPPTSKNYLVRFERPHEEKKVTPLLDFVSELGVYGVILGNESVVKENYEAGFLIRSKVAGTDEVGITAGYGCFSSPFLID